MRRFALLLVATVPLTACGEGGGGSGAAAVPAAVSEAESRPFDFGMVDESSLRVFVTRDGEPLARAYVSLVDELIPPANGDPMENSIAGNTYFQGYTDDNGALRATVPLPSRLEALDLIVDARGSTGPYTHESLRTLWGPFAPSSRIRILTADLDGITMHLVQEQS
ncbi:MAG: hypothetical protein ACYTG6_13640 [Planctomycetota bacterium]|jgi:hypothetical protein